MTQSIELQRMPPAATPPVHAGSAATGAAGASVARTESPVAPRAASASAEASGSQPPRTAALGKAATPPAEARAAATAPREERPAKQIAALNRANDEVALQGGFRPFGRDEFRALKKTNGVLRSMRRPNRDNAVRASVRPFYDRLQQPRLRTLAEVALEATTLQGAAATLAGIGFAPTLINHFAGLSKTLKGAGGYFALQLGLNVLQPFINVYIFNTFYSAFDLTRKVGQPGRSGQLEGINAPRLKDAFDQLQVAVRDLEEAIRQGQARQTTDGTAMSDADAIALVGGANAEAKGKLEQRYTAEAFADSFEVSRYAQSALGAMRQVFYVLTAVTKFAIEDQRKAGSEAFKLLTYGAAALQGLQAAVAIAERLGESDRMVKKNLAYTDIQSMSDVRGMGPIGLGGMIRSPNVQVGWAINDSVDKPISQQYKKLARQLGLSESAIRKLDDDGAFNHPKFSRLAGNLPPERQAKLDAFMTSCEGAPIAGCRGAIQELEKMVVLEDLTKLLILEDVSRLNVLHALEKLQQPMDGAAADDAGAERYTPSLDEIRSALDLGSNDHALAVLKSPLTPQRAQELADLRTVFDLHADGASRDQLEPIRKTLGLASREHARQLVDPGMSQAFRDKMVKELPAAVRAAIGEAAASFDPEAQERHEAVLTRMRITLKLDSNDDAADLLQGPAGYETNVMPKALKTDLAQLKAKYADDNAFRLLQATLGFDSLDEAKALRGGLTDEMDRLLTQLHDKYETRKSLDLSDIKAVSRQERIELVGSVRATNDPDVAISAVRGMVIGRLFPKFLTSSLNADKWQVQSETLHPDSDQARRDKSLTPFEHTLLQMLLAMPKAVMDFTATPPRPRMEEVHNEDGTPKLRDGRPVMRPIANTKALNAPLPAPRSMAEVHDIMDTLLDHKMDKATLGWDFTDLSAKPTQRILNVLGERDGAITKAANFARNVVDVNLQRWNMEGYLTPAITAQVARQTLFGVGGTLTFLLIGALVNMVAVGLTQNGTFTHDPVTGAANKNKQAFDRATFAVQALLAIPAVYAAASSGAFSILSSNLRGKEFFLRPGGRPTFFKMLKEHYAYGANLKRLPWKDGAGAATDHSRQAWPGGPGRAAVRHAEARIAEADAWLDQMFASNGAGKPMPRIVELDDDAPDDLAATGEITRPAAVHNADRIEVVAGPSSSPFKAEPA